MDVLGDVFAWIYESLIEPFLILHSFGNLIYGRGRTEELVHNTFHPSEITEIYQPGSMLVTTIAGFVIVSAIVIAGMRIGSTTINPANRTYYIEFLKDLGIVLIVFFNLSFLYDLVFTANSGIVSVFDASQAEESGLIETVSGTGIIGSILVGIIMLFLMLWANWYYMMRKLTLLILMIIGPLMVALFLIPKFKPITSAWFKEFVGTVFVQSVHAVLYWIITMMVAGQDPDLVTEIINIETVILYLIFIPVGESIRSLLGMGGGMSTSMSKAGAMLGMSALAGVYGSVKGALDKDNGSVLNSLKQAKDGVDKVNKGSSDVDEESTIRDATLSANTGTDSGTTPKAEGMLKWGDIGNRAGKAILGSAGSIGGAAIGGPMGSMVGASTGFAAGGVAGGLTGRFAKAGKDFAANRFSKGKDAAADAWSEYSNPLNATQEELASKLAEKETADYENENKSNFIEQAKKNFPDLDEKGLEMKWEEHKNGIHDGNIAKARNLVRKAFNNDGKLANAQNLAVESANEMTNQWAQDNKAKFDEEYDKANPLPTNATKADILNHNQKKDDAWNEKVASQKELYQGIANKTANQLKDSSMGNHMLNKDEFGKVLADNLQEHDQQAFIAEYQKQNPNATIDEAKDAFSTIKGNNAKSNFTKAYMAQNKGATVEQAEKAFDAIHNSSSKDDYINKAMADATTQQQSQSSQTYDLAKNHDNDRDGFISSYQANIDPTASKEQAGKIFDSVQSSDSKQGFIQSQTIAPTEAMRKQAGNNYDLAAQGSKEAFVQTYQSNNPSSTREQAEALFNKANGISSGGQESYSSYANSAIQNVKPEAIYNKGTNKDVDRGYFTNQLAATQTLADKSNFIKEQVDNGMTKADANTMWASQEKQRFNDNLNHYDKQLPQTISLKHSVGKSSGLQKLKAGTIATSAFVGQATGFTPTVEAVKNATRKGYLVTQSFKDGFSQGSESVNMTDGLNSDTGKLNTAINQIKASTSGLSQGIQSAKEALQPNLEDAVDKHQSFRKAVAYTGGLIGGVKLYQKSANFAARVNPYNKAVNSSSESGVYEASEIRQMASHRDEETGQSYIPQGNIKLVTTANESYVQVKDSAGQNRIVSRYGAGDSALESGQVSYQDLTIDDRGGLKPISLAYQYDTGGNKVETGRNINVNPNKLIAINRPDSVNTMATQDVAPYNSNVETGSFSRNDAMMKMDDIRMIITKERSYMVGIDKSTGEEVRISPYKVGDARLDVNEIRQVDYKVENKRFNIAKTTDHYGNMVNYEPPMDTDEYLYRPNNPRLHRRSIYEAHRYKAIGGAE